MNIVPKDIYQLAILESLARDRSRAFYTRGRLEHKAKVKLVLEEKNKELAEEHKRNTIFFNTLFGIEKNILLVLGTKATTFGTYEDLIQTLNKNGIYTFPNGITLPVDNGKSSLVADRIFEQKNINDPTTIILANTNNTRITKKIIAYTFYTDKQIRAVGSYWPNTKRFINEKIKPSILNTPIGDILGYALHWPEKKITVYFINSLRKFMTSEDIPLEILTTPETTSLQKPLSLTYKENALFSSFQIFGVKKGPTKTETQSKKKSMEKEKKELDEDSNRMLNVFNKFKEDITKMDISMQMTENSISMEEMKPEESRNIESINQMKSNLDTFRNKREKLLDERLQYTRKSVIKFLKELSSFASQLEDVYTAIIQFANEKLNKLVKKPGSEDIKANYGRILEVSKPQLNAITKALNTLKNKSPKDIHLMSLIDIKGMYSGLKTIVEFIQKNVFTLSGELLDLTYGDLIIFTIKDVVSRMYSTIINRLVLLENI